MGVSEVHEIAEEHGAGHPFEEIYHHELICTCGHHIGGTASTRDEAEFLAYELAREHGIRIPG
jgi:hypothetical protein